MAAKKKSSYHHGDLQNALLEAGLALLAEGGPEALTLREVAKRAGVSHAAPYRHFPSKEHLLAAVAEKGFRALSASLRGAMEGVTGAEARLVAQGLGYVRFSRAHPAELRVMFREGAFGVGSAGLQEAGAEAFGLLVEGVQACQAAGVFPPGEPLSRAVACWSLVHGFAVLALEGAFAGPAGVGEGDSEAAARAALEMLVRGMRK